MRRFAPVAIPGLGLGAAALAQAAWTFGRNGLRTAVGIAPGAVRRGRRGLTLIVGAGVVAVAVAGGTVGATAAITWPVREDRAQVPMRDRMEAICEAAGDDAAILVPIDGKIGRAPV